MGLVQLSAPSAVNTYTVNVDASLPNTPLQIPLV